MDMHTEQEVLRPDEVIRLAIEQVLAEPKARRAHIRRTLSEAPPVLQAVAQVLTTQSGRLEEVIKKLGHQVVYRALLTGWNVTTSDQKDRIIAELHHSHADRALASAIALGLVPSDFDHAVALLEQVSPLVSLPDFVKREFSANAADLLRKLDHSHLAEFRQRKLLTLILLSLHSKDESHLTIATGTINRWCANKIDPAPFQSDKREKWIAYLQELGPKQREIVGAVLVDAGERYCSAFWDSARLGPIPSHRACGHPHPTGENIGAAAKNPEGQKGEPKSANSVPALPSTIDGREDEAQCGGNNAAPSCLTTEPDREPPSVSASPSASANGEDEAVRWLTAMKSHISTLLDRVQSGAVAAAKVIELERALADKTEQLSRLEIADNEAQTRIEERDQEIRTARRRDEQLSSSVRELGMRIQVLEEQRQHSEREIRELKATNALLEVRIVETEEARLEYGEQKTNEVKRALAERLGRELEDLPELESDLGGEDSRLVAVRFRRLIALLKENEILGPSQGARRG